MKPKFLLCIAILMIGLTSRSYGVRPRLPEEVLQALGSPAAISLYSVHPDPRCFHWWFTRWFHDYRILGRVSITDPVDQRQVVSVVKQAAQTYFGDAKCGFSPRHAVRLSSGSRTYDFLICFECSKMVVFSGDQHLTSLSIGGSPDALNQILRKARIRIAR